MIRATINSIPKTSTRPVITPESKSFHAKTKKQPDLYKRNPETTIKVHTTKTILNPP